MTNINPKHLAAQYLQSQNYAAAAEVCSKYCKQAKKDPEGWLLLGSIYGAMKDYKAAVTAFKKAEKIKPNDPVILFNLSVALEKSNDLAGARKHLEKAIRLKPDFFEAQSNLTEILFNLDLADAALLSCERAITLKPNYAASHLTRGNLLRNMKKFEAAKSAYDQCITLNPQFDEVYIDYGILHNLQDDTTSADASFSKALLLNPASSRAKMQCGLLKFKQHDFDACIQLLQESLTLAADNDVAHYNLAIVFKHKERFDEAVNHFLKAIAIKPLYIDAYLGLANLYTDMGALDKAMDVLESARSYNPDNVEYYLILGTIMGGRGNFYGALDEIKKGIALDPHNSRAYLNLGLAYKNINEYDKALAAFDKAIALAAHDPYSEVNSVAGKAMIYERRKDQKQAYELIKPYINATTIARIALVYGQVAEHLNLMDHAIEVMHSALDDTETNTDNKIEIHFQLGKIYDKRNMFEKAFEHYKTGNEYFRLLNSDFIGRYKYEDTAAYFNQTRAFFTREFFDTATSSELGSELPIFIVGMPRSGTTLTETILSNHALVHGAGELPDIPVIKMQCETDTGISFPACLRNIDKSQLKAYASSHLNKLKRLSPEAIRIVDKMPHNFLLLGLISLLYPNCKIIHIQRYPVDNCLSIYFQRFNISHTYASDLVDLADYYKLYTDMMQHWNEVLPTPILNIKYDELVTNQEEISRQMIAFCGLDWDANCLAFHKSKRDVATPSYDQVSQPMYTKSSGRWRNYEHYIELLTQRLEQNGAIAAFTGTPQLKKIQP